MSLQRGKMLEIDRLAVHFGAVAALADLSLDVARGEVVCLLGPSGSGKSTLLRAIAGLKDPTSGRIAIDDVEVAGPRSFVEPEDRGVGMVFQDYALFPHLTVAQNIAFGAARERELVAALIERLGLARLARNYPHELSGGERQRVALARAMAPQPRLLLMDEPFASLDNRLRDDVRVHTLRFLRESGMTTVIVTHDPNEAMRIADRIALLHNGRQVQVGTPEDIYNLPRTLFAARFFGDVAAVPGIVANDRLETPLGKFAAAGLRAGTAATACIRAQHWAVAAAPTGLSGRVLASEFSGERRRLLVEVDGLAEPVAIGVPVTNRADGGPAVPGDVMHLEIDIDRVPVVETAKDPQTLEEK